MRLTHEQTRFEESCFGTLTYDDEHLPHDHDTPTLNYRDTHDFIHRTRKYVLRHFGIKIAYYLVGEYGDRSNRPHYHFVLFGHAFTENAQILRTQPLPLWTSPELNKLWNKGFTSVGALTFESARYTASYVTKKLRAKQQYVRVDEETGELLKLVQPRAFMSLRPAIGKTWWERWHQGIIDHDRVIINGAPGKPPKYYDNLLKKHNETLYNAAKQKRAEKIKRETPEMRKSKADIARARAKAKKSVI